MAGDRMDKLLVETGLFQQLDTLDAVFFGPHFKVDIMQQTDNGPVFGLVAIAQLVGKILHAGADRLAMGQVELFLVVFFQKRQSFGFIHHGDLSFLQFPTKSAILQGHLSDSIDFRQMNCRKSAPPF